MQERGPHVVDMLEKRMCVPGPDRTGPDRQGCVHEPGIDRTGPDQIDANHDLRIERQLSVLFDAVHRLLVGKGSRGKGVDTLEKRMCLVSGIRSDCCDLRL